ncbi:MAG: phospholipase A [Proteobacteria bacterium]|nr:phospholipase A [Pseudomonadota bacterium]
MLKKFYTPILLLLIGASSLWAQDAPEPFLRTLEPYKPIYILHSRFLKYEGEEQGYQDRELVIQFSFKKRIYRNLHFAYSHKAFWQVYDQPNSRPFRENNYNPEFFLEYSKLWKLDYLRLGLTEHESNGEKQRFDENANPVNYSRTWNRSYLFVRQQIEDYLELELKVWILTNSDNEEYGSFSTDNADMQQYMGIGELYAVLGRFPTVLTVMLRRGWRKGTETVRLEGRIPIHLLTSGRDTGLDIYLQAFAGYGDSLIDYNRKIRRLAIGLSFR